METFNFMINGTSKGSHIETQIRGKAVCAAICVLFLGCWRSEQSDSWVKAEYCAVGLYIQVCRGTGNTVLQNKLMYLRKQESKVGIQWGTISR